MSSSQAGPLYEALSLRADIGIEIVRFRGKLSKVDEKNRTWRMVTDEDLKEISGFAEVDLAGLVIENQKYEFTCEERLEEEKGTGREFARLVLTSYVSL